MTLYFVQHCIVAITASTRISLTNKHLEQQFEAKYQTQSTVKMIPWTHVIRFQAVEDGQIHLGQLVDTTRDIGLDSVNGTEIKAFLINGDIFNGTVTEHVLTVQRVSCPSRSLVSALVQVTNLHKAASPSDPRAVLLYQVSRTQL